METINIIVTIKFGSKENIYDLYENGTIYCNPLEYFRKQEDSFLRGDSYEGTYKITNFPPDSKITIALPNKELELKTAKLHLREFYKELPGNVYCLTAITVDEVVQSGLLTLDERNMRFGSHFLLIKNNKEFYKRLLEGFAKANLTIRTGLVKYYNRDTVSSELGLFYKSNEFEYQKEFRVLIENQLGQPIKIQIGSIQDIANVFDIKELTTLVCKYDKKSDQHAA